MTEKPFQLGLLVGRFQSIHLGHKDMVDRALSLCEEVVLLVGSAQEEGTAKNPFSYALRREMLRTVFGPQIHIFPLIDIGIGNNAKWGDYVLDQVQQNLGRLPDLFVSGKEERRTEWFSNERGQKLFELVVPKTIEMSASQMRRYFLEDDQESWKKNTDPRLWERYAMLRQQVLSSRDNLESKSI